MKIKVLYISFILFSGLLLWACQPSGSSGEMLYENHCANCHMSDGKGVGTLYPDLNNSNYIQTSSLEIACFIRNGILATDESTARFEEYNMPPNQTLSDIDISNILNYLQREFNSKPTNYNFQNVKNKLNNCNQTE